jgi:hypothetical protein
MADNFLVTKRDAILKRWRDLVLDTYPEDAARFFKREKDRFANPVGAAVIEESSAIFDEVMAGPDFEKLHAPLDRIIRIRAVQDFSPSQALSFIFLLKTAIRDATADQDLDAAAFREMMAVEVKIDRAALFGFEIYMGCREQIYRIRADEIRNRTVKLLERSNLVGELPEGEGMESRATEKQG